jgi:hypothetical protein
MAINDQYNVQFEMINDDKIVCCNMVFREKVARVGTVAEVSAQLAQVADDAFWEDFWQLFASDELTYRRTVCQMIFPTREAPVVEADSAGEVGAVVKPAMNGTTAVLIGEYGEAWSANFRGRMYLPGIDEDSASLGRMKAATSASIGVAFTTNFITDIVLPAPADATMRLGVYSPTRAKVPTLPVSSDVATAFVRPRIATQRRRRTPVQDTTP